MARRLACLMAGLWLTAGQSHVGAGFTGPATASQSVTAASLAPPASLTAARGPCTVLAFTSVNLTWTATPSLAADGYEVFRSTTSGGPYSSIATVSGRTTTSYLDGSVAFSTTYHYVVKSKRNLWRSSNSNQASVSTHTALCI